MIFDLAFHKKNLSFQFVQCIEAQMSKLSKMDSSFKGAYLEINMGKSHEYLFRIRDSCQAYC
jgi:hypothetical protein